MPTIRSQCARKIFQGSESLYPRTIIKDYIRHQERARDTANSRRKTHNAELHAGHDIDSRDPPDGHRAADQQHRPRLEIEHPECI